MEEQNIYLPTQETIILVGKQKVRKNLIQSISFLFLNGQIFCLFSIMKSIGNIFKIMGDCTSKKQNGGYYGNDYDRYTNELQANSLRKSILKISKLEQPSLFPQQRKQGRKFYEEQIRTTPQRTITQKKTDIAELKMSPLKSNNMQIQNEMGDQLDQNQEHKSSSIIAKRSNESKDVLQKQEKQHKGAQTKEIISNATNHRKRSGSEDSSQGLSSKQSTVTRRSRAYIAGLEVISQASLQTSIRRDNISKHDKVQSFDPYSLGSNNPFYLHTQVVKTESAYQYGPSNPATFQWQVTI